MKQFNAARGTDSAVRSQAYGLPSGGREKAQGKPKRVKPALGPNGPSFGNGNAVPCAALDLS